MAVLYLQNVLIERVMAMIAGNLTYNFEQQKPLTGICQGFLFPLGNILKEGV